MNRKTMQCLSRSKTKDPAHLGKGCGKAVAVATQDCIKPQPADILAARLLVGYRTSPYITPSDLPDTADHRMPSLAIAEVVIDELPHCRAPGFCRQSAAACDRENRVQQPRQRIKATKRLAICPEPGISVQLVVLECYMLRVKVVEIPIDYRAFVRVADLVFSAGKRRHDEE